MRAHGSQGQKAPSRTEKLICFLILLFPCMGTFFAPETYFAPQAFSLEAARQPTEIGFQFARMAFLFILIWLIPRYLSAPAQMVQALLRSIIPIVLALWMIASALWTVDPAASFNRSGRMLILVLFAIYLAERYSTEEIVGLVAAAAAVSIAASTFAVIALPEYGYSGMVGYENAWRGAALHKNALGALMTVLFLFGLFAFSTAKASRPLACFVILGSTFLVMMSRSATSLLVLLVTVCLAATVVLLNAFRTTSEKIVIIGGVSCLFLIACLAQPRFEEILALVGRDPSLTGRTDVWESVRALVAERPLLGFGHVFWAIDSLERDRIWMALGWAAPHAHNMVLDIRLQLGLVGLAIAACFFAVALWQAVRLLMHRVPPILLIWPLVVLTTLFRGLSETYLVDPDPGGLFWCTLAFAGMAKSLSRVHVSHQSAVLRPRPVPHSARIQVRTRPLPQFATRRKPLS